MAEEHDAEFLAKVQARREARMEKFDKLSPEMRECVREYGMNVVNQCANLGIKEARHVRHLVETILDEFSPTRGCYSAQGRAVRADDQPESQRRGEQAA